MFEPRITVLPAAAKFMRRMVRFSDHPAGGFRLTVAPGGCSGYASEFSIEAAPQAGDSELSVDGVRVFLPAQSRLLLDGVTVDFADSPTASGLTFANPAQGACGCASSETAPPPPAAVDVASIKRVAQA